MHSVDAHALWHGRTSAHDTVREHAQSSLKEKEERGGGQGLVQGVIFPCMSNILGVIVFLRGPWITGKAGILGAFCLAAICSLCTFVTSFSLSAIATNGKISGGGAYFLISRSLGPAVGASVGLCFYMANSIGAAMYFMGTVEAWEIAMPQYQVIGVGDPNNIRVTGFCILIGAVLIVGGGIKYVAKAGTMFLMIVLFTLVCMYAGVLAGPVGDSGTYTVVNKDNDGSPLEMTLTWTGIRGAAKYFTENFGPAYDQKQYALEETEPYNFITMMGLWFPSVTGIMAGSNRSADLADPSGTIPKGTIFATTFTTCIYLSFLVLYGCIAPRETLLNDKFFAATAAWPAKEIVIYGVIASTIGAGLTSLTSGTRLLSAIAKDGTLPILRHFRATPGKEPRMALVASGALCACAIAVGALNAIAPVLTMFFLMCYTCVNFSCFMSEVLSDPNWRPRFRYYHWAQSLFGTVLCIWMMFALSAIYAMIAMIFAACVFLYASYHSSKVKWGDGFQGMKFQVARNILMHLDLSTHTKNWRPQVLVVTKASAPVGGGEQDSRPETVVLEDPELVTFASQLKGGRGITIIGGICSSKPSGLFGNDSLFLDQRQRQNLKDGQMAMKQMLHDNEIQGFGRVVYTDDFSEGLLCMVQTCGIGAFQPNCILASWPTNWDAPGAEGVKVRTEFVRLVQASVVFQKVVLLSKNQTVPALTTRLGGTIDIWWVVADGGILLLLPFLLKKHPVWRRCRTRLFAVADKINDDVTEMQRELEAYVNDFRLDVEVHVKVIDPEDGTASRLSKNPVSFSNWRRVATNPESARGLNEDFLRAQSNPEVRFPRLLQTHESCNEENEITGQKRSFSAADAIAKAQKDSDAGSLDNVCANSRDVMLNLPHAKDKKAFPMVAPTGLGNNLARDLSEQVEFERNTSAAIAEQSKPSNKQNCDQNFTSITIEGPQVSKDQVGEPAISGGDTFQTVNMHGEASFIHSTDQMESNIPLSAGELALGRALNRAMLSESGKAELIVTNLPDMPTAESALGYFQLVDELTRDLPRCLLVRGTQLEVITAFT